MSMEVKTKTPSKKIELELAGFQGTENSGFPARAWKRCEFHRNAFSLLPAPSDKNPGIAFVVFNERGDEFQRFCTCSKRGKRTCPHILELSRLLQSLEVRGGALKQPKLFESSVWRQLAAVLFEHGGGDPSPIQIRGSGNGDSSVLEILNRAGGVILSYLSQGEDLSRFLERLAPFADAGEVPGRADILKKLTLLTLTESERGLMERGFKSRRRAMEESPWYGLAYHVFREFGTHWCSLTPAIEEGSGMFTISCGYRDGGPVFRLFVPRLAVEKVLHTLRDHLPNQNEFPIHPIPLKSLFKVNRNTEMDLEVRPVIQLLQEDGEEKFFEREDLERFRYGRLVFIPEMGVMAELEKPEQARRFGPPRKMVLRRSQVPTFLDSISRNGGSDRHLLEGEVQRLKIFRVPDRLEIAPDAVDRDWCWLSVTYGFGNELVSLADILEAGEKGQRYLSLSSGWVDCESPDLKRVAERCEKAKRGKNGKGLFRFSKMDLLRLKGSLGDDLALAGKGPQRKRLDRFFQLKPYQSSIPLDGMTSSLRDYQHAGVQWLYFLYENGLGGLLCDDMGLGKTHQVMALMTAVLESKGPDVDFLVVCPTTVLGHWERKIREHAPGLTAAVHHGMNRDFRAARESGNVILTSYGILRNDIELFKGCTFTLAAFDEAQSIKNTGTLGYQAALEVRAGMKLGVTGTPIENDLKELKALMDLTLPGYLGGDDHFATHYAKPIQEAGDKSRRRELRRLLSPFTLRRLKKSVLEELPPKIEDTRFCRLSEDQVKLYRDAVELRGKKLLNELEREENPIPYIHIFSLLNILKQICDHPALLKKEAPGGEDMESGKWDLFCELLTESLESGQKVVVYSQYLGMIRLFEGLLERMGVGYVSLTGSTARRGEVIARFNDDGNCRVYLGSLKAGGVGIDLVAASVVIHYDRWWNAAREDQATDRVHRIGQKRGVQVFKLVTEGTLEEKIDTIIRRKRDLMESVVQEDDPGLLKNFSREDLIELLTFSKS